MLDALFDDVKRMNKRQVFFTDIVMLRWRGRAHSSIFTGCCTILLQFIYQVLSFGMIVSSALMIWKGLMVVTGSESPIVVVLSGSMEPAFHRGDLLFLTNYPDEPVRVGEIVVFKVEGRDIPIVHRVLKLHEK